MYRIFDFPKEAKLEEWKEKRLLPLNASNNPLGDDKRSNFDFEYLAKFLPCHELINENSEEICFMSVKICGIFEYSRYCERAKCMTNPFEFLEIVSDFYAPIAEIISNSNGIVLKALPNELWSVWRVGDGISLSNLVHKVINCALHIQRIRDNFRLNSWFKTIRIKIGISLGSIHIIKVDDDESSYLFYTGKCLDNVREIVKFGLPGQILLAKPLDAKKFQLASYFYITEHYEKFIKILGMGPNWRPLIHTGISQLKTKQIDGQFDVDESSSEETLFEMNPVEIQRKTSRFPDGATNEEAGAFLNVLPKPLKSSILKLKPLNSVAKIQAIIVLHLRLDLNQLENASDLMEIVLKTLCGVILNGNGYLYRSKVSKSNVQLVFVFECGDSSLETNCKDILNNSLGAFVSFRRLKEIRSITIGIASGLSFCGVVLRSYFLLSSAFKIASKLTKLYAKNRIVCDKKIVIFSRKNRDEFVLLEYRHMNDYEPGQMFEFVGNFKLKNVEFPLLGNEENLAIMLETFDNFRASPSNSNVLVVKGEKKQGKTRILNEFSRRIVEENNNENIKIVHVELKDEKKSVRFHAISMVFEILLGLSTKNSQEKHARIVELLENSKKELEFVCALNGILETNFEIGEEFERCSAKEKIEICERILRKLAQACFSSILTVVEMDGVEFIDEESCNLLYDFIGTRKCFMALTLTKRWSHRSAFLLDGLIEHNCAVVVNLEDLIGENVAAFACQILNVYAIQTELKKYLESCRGNPGTIRDILLRMFERNELVLTFSPAEKTSTSTLVVPSLELTKRKYAELKTISISPRKTNDSNGGNFDGSGRIESSFPVCLLAPHLCRNGAELWDIAESSVPNFAVSFEGLSRNQKFVLEAASVLIGDSFPRSILIYVLNLKKLEISQIDLAEAIQGLFELGIFSCGKYWMKMKLRSTSNSENLIGCDCINELGNPKNQENLSMAEAIRKCSFCNFLRFNSKMYKNFVGRLVNAERARGFRLRALKYLGRETRRCYSCGNGLMSENISFSENFEVDHANCECETIMASVHKQKIELFRALERYEEMFESALAYSELCLSQKNYENPLNYLRCSLKIMQPVRNREMVSIEAEMYQLAGSILLALKRTNEAHTSFHKTLDLLNESFPNSNNLRLYLKLFTSSKFVNTINIVSSKKKACLGKRSEILCKSLNGLFRIYKFKNDWRRAELCAIWSLKSAFECAEDVRELVLISLTNLMKLGAHSRQQKMRKFMEVFGLNYCDVKKSRQAQFMTIEFHKERFKFGFHHSNDSNHVSNIGNLLVKLSIDLGSVQEILSTVPRIVLALIYQKKIVEIHTILRRIQYNNDGTDFGLEFWFHICNLVLMIETGICTIPFDECLKYFKDSEEINLISEKKRTKLSILIWINLVRQERWKESFDLFRKLIDSKSLDFCEEKMELFSLYIFEGVLLYLVQRTRNRNLLSEPNLENEVVEICKKLEVDLGTISPVHVPRFVHLKAYQDLIKNDEKSILINLEKGLELARTSGNVHEESWIKHSRNGWFGNLPDFMRDAWRKTDDVHGNVNEVIHFTLPTPIN